MARRREHSLSDLQLAVMRVLWADGASSVAEVRDALAPERDLAVTTVATVLARLAERGVVTKRSVGRQLVYRAHVGEADVRRTMVSALMERLFEGDASALVSHLLREGEIDPAELSALRRRLAAEKRRRDGDG